MRCFDIIGDIHGCNETLEKLLQTLGYEVDQEGAYRHDHRQAVFLGDFIDRGPGQREVISIVKNMVDAGSAMSVMGNHEFNAIAYATFDEASGTHLRPHSDKNNKQHEAFLDAFSNDETSYQDAIGWFKTLPMWLDLGEIRIVGPGEGQVRRNSPADCQSRFDILVLDLHRAVRELVQGLGAVPHQGRIHLEVAAGL